MRDDLSGRIFGKWTVLRMIGQYRWLCRCVCGIEKSVNEFDLLGGKSKQCTTCHKVKHRHTVNGRQSPTYSTWMCMVRRCSDPTMNDYERYGGRGIEVCDRWRDFRNFLNDMGERPENHVLDRKEGDGNYEPANCRWVTHKESATNRTSTRWVMYRGEQVSCTEAARRLEWNMHKLRSKLIRLGWPNIDVATIS